MEYAYPEWGVTLAATFLTGEEISAWQNRVSDERSGPTIVLPELPPLPPRSAVTVLAYGDVSDAEVSATVPGASFKLIPTVRVEDSGLIALILRPEWMPFALGALGIVFLLAFAIFENVSYKRARRFVTYDLACNEAKAGREESALALLQEAVDAGYRNFQHMRSDPDLEGLRDNDAFKKLADMYFPSEPRGVAPHNHPFERTVGAAHTPCYVDAGRACSGMLSEKS
jgi:hypothetical protein